MKLYGLMELEENQLFSNVASYFNLMYKRNKTFLKEKSIKKPRESRLGHSFIVSKHLKM